ncbi:MAG TPA: hypothetical protein VNU68_09880 [Verrucomicrobiae bacterium]|nr:hypothetical protein [Verrucomicrobiae bacterium]
MSENNEAEIARFKDTGKTIVHRGTEYAVLNPPDDEDRADSPYILRSSRGKYYALTRNRPKPYLLFGVGLYGQGLKCMPGWFSDKDGELKSLG